MLVSVDIKSILMMMLSEERGTFDLEGRCFWLG